jgi:hypothetical protein
MSLPIISYEKLHRIIAEESKITDEKCITEVVGKVHNRVMQTAELGYFFTEWTCALSEYKYKHIVLAANRLRVLFPGADVQQKKGHTITVNWH